MKFLNRISRMLICLILVSTAASAQNKYSKTVDIEKGTRLDVNINPGDIIIKTWDKSQVQISADGLDEGDNAVKVDKRNNVLSVNYNSGWSDNVIFTFTVPENIHVSARTTGGDIKVLDKIIGDISLNTSGGDIKTKDLQGRISIATSGGDISTGDLNGDVSVGTSGGDVRLGVITGESANINTMGGDIDIKRSEASLSVKTYGGDITVGDIGGNAEAVTFGGDITLGSATGNVKMETYGGDLELSSAKGVVQADTKGGNIRLRNITGSVEAKTAGGEIYAELTPSDKGESTFKSLGGKIELLLPANAKVDVEAMIKIRGSKEKKYSVQSDFSESKSVTSGDKKEITSSFTVNGGGHKVKIYTVNSDIYIKKK